MSTLRQTMPDRRRDTREQAAVLALVRATEREWYKTAVMIEEVGSALRFLSRQWTGFEPFDVASADALAARVAPGDVDKFEDMIWSFARSGVKLVTVLDDQYPGNLRAIYNRPPMLFVKGDILAPDEKAVAVVGTRTATPEGLRTAEQLAFQLARRGITILSGLARGIDTAAHTGALRAKGRTIAVMGTGILHAVYPPENAGLADEIRTHGALVSQFWPDAPPRSSNFPLRNVVTSGMSIGTVVVEASSTSGAKMQARLALEHGKKVFLLKSLVLAQEWARKYARRPNAVVVEAADQIVDLVEDLLRPPQQLSLA